MKRWRGTMILLTVLLVTPFAAWRFVVSQPMLRARSLGFCPVDQTYSSPNGTHTIRVLMTDGGATGYGGIFVYRWSWLKGYQRIFAGGKAVAIPDTHTVTWVSENECLVQYTSPGKGAVQQRITL